MYSDYKNKMFVDKFFEKHKVFSCKNLHWDVSNDQLRNRIKYLFSEYGFFNYILKENEKLTVKCKCKFINDCSHHNPYRCLGDNPSLHNQQRYICQEVIADNIFNPIHVSLKSRSKRETYNLSSLDYSKNDNKRTLIVTIHPGHTRMFASSFLKKNLTNSLIYVNKKNYYENMLKGDLEEITNINQLFPLWKPYKKVNTDLLYFNFKLDKKSAISNDLLPITLHGPLKNCSNKYHRETDSFVLKVWQLHYIDKTHREDMLHTREYLQEIYNSSWNISKILFEKKLTIYTNSKEDVKNYFLDIRKNLINTAKMHMSEEYFCKVNIKKHFDFDVVVVEDKPNDISKLNENKGFAIWIDKSILKDINREIYEFVVFTRHDIKLSETEDGKISITNCKNIGDKKWIIHKEFYS